MKSMKKNIEKDMIIGYFCNGINDKNSMIIDRPTNNININNADTKTKDDKIITEGESMILD